ncbi:MAG: energy transducer TonB [Candidatus Sulfotelmatobacter sp.]|jgi:TonB family protein
MFRGIVWPGFLIFTVALATASVQAPLARERTTPLGVRELQTWKPPARAAEFTEVPHLSVRSRCADTQPPEALTTPAPLLVPVAAGAKVKVSFIVGADGRVHSPIILQSSGVLGDRNVLQTVRNWRYRPATCNGVPIETEGRIEFSRR